jgi:anion-transporting  ArsA/GET3 family ATPase
MNLNNYLTDLNDNTQSVVKVVSEFSSDEMMFKNGGDCSIADILEHICISDNRTLYLLRSESNEISPTNELYGDEKLKKIVVDYKGGPRITETEIKELKGIVTDFSSFEKEFMKTRAQLLNALKTGEITISNKAYKHLYLGGMTVTDWLKYIIYHTTRHLNDIKESSLEVKKAKS